MLFPSRSPFVVGELSRSVGSVQARTINNASELEQCVEGDVFTRWDWIGEWGDGCVKPSQLEKLRHVGDPLADAVVRFFILRTGEDALGRLQSYVNSTPREEWDLDVAAFWNSVARDVPSDVTGLQPGPTFRKLKGKKTYEMDLSEMCREEEEKIKSALGLSQGEQQGQDADDCNNDDEDDDDETVASSISEESFHSDAETLNDEDDEKNNAKLANESQEYSSSATSYVYHSDLPGAYQDKCEDNRASSFRKDQISIRMPVPAAYVPEEAIQRRNRNPLPILCEGQAVFWRYSSDIFFELLHFSLAGGFASARIMSVLHETGYLTSSSRDGTYRRLMETTQALVDFMNDMTPITGKGWQSAVRVRLLHAQVRVRILEHRTRLRTYDIERDGIPINQEDMAGTLCGFCLAPLWCQRKLGVTLTMQEELAFIAAWRHVGYYLGVSPVLLRTFFSTSDLNKTARSDRFFASVAFHLFAGPDPPKDPFATSTYKILHAVAHRPPQNQTTLYHCELSRLLLGRGLADQLGIPHGNWKDKLATKKHAWESWIQGLFSKYYFSRWEVQRQMLLRRVITLIVAWQLGERRTRFTWRDEKHHERKISELMELSSPSVAASASAPRRHISHKHSFSSPPALHSPFASKNPAPQTAQQEKEQEYSYAEAGEFAGVKFGPEVGREVRWQAVRVFGEMGVVIAGVGIGLVVAGIQGIKMACSLAASMRS